MTSIESRFIFDADCVYYISILHILYLHQNYFGILLTQILYVLLHFRFKKASIQATVIWFLMIANGVLISIWLLFDKNCHIKKKHHHKDDAHANISGQGWTRTNVDLKPADLQSAAIAAMRPAHGVTIGNWTRIFRATIWCTSLYTIATVTHARLELDICSLKDCRPNL